MTQTNSHRSGRRRAVLLALCGAVLALVTACGSDSGSSKSAAGATSSSASSSSSSSGSAAGSSPGTSAEVVIHIEDFGYQVPESVSPGATVSVMNMDGEAHTVTADEGDAFDAQVTGDATGTFTAPMTPGSYPFHCTYHSNMHGVLVVQ
ncbi:cupredoxin domain-containing protein [Modestobacter excelsi]|uniref:cupredoxin domain-containing protein n=1 Tax=Modestobacter excelsi TaxID=2213161 RepID=UPI001C20E273|nr:cupredoxin domain-containing protein [Modestobacter excelsi]